jgi:transcriptional regulator of arginine metabolism
MAKSTKHQRHHRITQLLEEQVVSSQGQLVDLLGSEGIVVTTATVSRDLQELGVITVRIPGGDNALALPELPTQQVAPVDHLRRVLGEWAVGISVSGSFCVVRTPPGCAHVVASALDRSIIEGVLGTVAGDDTILVAVDDEIGAQAVAEQLADYSGVALRTRGQRAKKG